METPCTVGYDRFNHHVVSGPLTSYVPADSTKAGLEYDKFISETKKITSHWTQIDSVLKFVYENAREGDYNSHEKNSVFNNLHSGREKYIAYQMDKMSGTCGQYADFSADIFNELGFCAGRLNLGADKDAKSNPVMLHTVLGVVVEDKVYVLDPMFCRYYLCQEHQAYGLCIDV